MMMGLNYIDMHCDTLTAVAGRGREAFMKMILSWICAAWGQMVGLWSFLRVLSMQRSMT